MLYASILLEQTVVVSMDSILLQWTIVISMDSFLLQWTVVVSTDSVLLQQTIVVSMDSILLQQTIVVSMESIQLQQTVVVSMEFIQHWSMLITILMVSFSGMNSSCSIIGFDGNVSATIICAVGKWPTGETVSSSLCQFKLMVGRGYEGIQYNIGLLFEGAVRQVHCSFKDSEHLSRI